MARYIDVDALLERFDEEEPMNWNDTEAEMQEHAAFMFYRWLVESAPTADVVPRAEVDQLKATIDRLEREHAEMLLSATTDIPISMVTLFKVRTEHPIFKAIKSEVAREIFEGLRTSGLTEWRYPIIAELKKKYGLAQPFAELEQKLTEDEK